jgi:hypothetical protein
LRWLGFEATDDFVRHRIGLPLMDVVGRADAELGLDARTA